MIYIAQIFALLGIISTRKDSAQALLKVLINKYSHAFSEDESNFYIFNFIDLLKQIPTISFANIVENILSKVEASTNPLSSL